MTHWTAVPLFGPNRWSSRSVLELHVSESSLNRSVAVRHAMVACLRSFLDSGRFTTTHRESVSNARQCLEAIAEATDTGQLWLAAARWMSAMAGVPTRCVFPHDETSARGGTAQTVAAAGQHPRFQVTPSQVTPSQPPFQTASHSESGVLPPSELGLESVRVLPMEMEEELLSRRCFELAELMLDTLHAGDEFPIALKFRELFDYADDVRLGPSSRAILDAATERGIPYHRLTSGSLVQLGEGIHQRRIWTAETDATSAIAESIASDKDLTKRLLRNVGVPVPLGRMVTSPEDAWSAAQEVGFPVVVKPRDANHQRGISIELSERDDILKAYHWAIEDGQTTDVMVEQFARGQHHRLLVVGDRLIAASRGHVETVLGDGVRSVEQLVHELNQDPRRGEAYTDPLGIVKLDAAAQIELAKQGLSIQSIPEAHRSVLIRRTGDLTTDCTEEVHPATARQAVLAARVIGLDVAGLDVLALDIGQPLHGQRGAVVEVNAGPSLTPHVVPLFGKPRPVGAAIIDLLFPGHRTSRIEIVGVLAGTHREDALQAIEIVIDRPEWDGLHVGVLDKAEVAVDGECIELGDIDSRARAAALLGNPGVDCLVLSIDPLEMVRLGSPVPRIDRLVVTSAGAMHWLAHGEDAFWATLQHALSRHAKLEFGALPMELQRAILEKLARNRNRDDGIMGA